MNAIDHLSQDAAVPVAWLAIAADARGRVPVATVDLPRHPGVLADFVDIAIALLLGLGRGEVEEFSRRARPGGENGDKGEASVRGGA